MTRAPLANLFFAFVAGVVLTSLTACGLGRDSAGDGDGVTNPIVAATVNGRPIYVEDVRAHAVSRGWLQETEDLDANSDAFYMALEELIQIRLFAMEAEARGLDRDPAVRRQLENARERVLAAAIYEEIDQRATDPEAAERLYRENVSRLGRGEQVHLRQIVFTSREAADAAKRRLDRGERFEALAFELNADGDGGDLGFVDPADLVPPVRNELSNVSNGGLVGPVQVSDRWFIFRLEDRRAIDAPSLEELRPRIIDWLRYREIVQLDERLARDARIERLRQPEEPADTGGDVTAPADAEPEAPLRPAPSTGGASPPFPFPMGPGGVTGGAPSPPPQPAPAPAAPAPSPPADDPPQNGGGDPTDGPEG